MMMRTDENGDEDSVQDQPKWWRSGKEISVKEKWTGRIWKKIWMKKSEKDFNTIIRVIKIQSRTNLNGGELERI